jgi:methyl-accepting chemotaxis protein
MTRNTWTRNRLTVRIAVVVTVVLLLLSVGFIWVETLSARQTTLGAITTNGKHIAASAAERLDKDRLERFLANPGEDESYWAMRDELDQFRQRIGALYVYIFRIDEEGRSFIMIDGQPQDSDVASPIGEETDVEPEQTELLLSGKTANSVIVDDPLYGKYVSAYAPILRADGTTMAVLGIDTDAAYVDSVTGSMLRANIPYYLLIVVLALAGLAVIVAVLVRSLRPIRWIVSGAERIASGDFDEARKQLQAHPVKARDEVGAMYRAIVGMSSSLNGLIQKVVSSIAVSSDQLVAASGQLSGEARDLLERNARVHQAAARLAEGASAQRISTEECARSMEEITSGLQRITEASQVLSEASIRALESAEDGKARMERMNEQIRSISAAALDAGERVTVLSERSREIEDAIRSITEIAGQTKLLAFNAAIEAARAGEHGRGFTIVAGEVRKLADVVVDTTRRIASLLQHMQEETRQISEAMKGNVAQVRAGQTLSDEVEHSFGQVVEMFRLVSGQIEEISAASQEISASSEEVEASIVEISRIASASSEQTLHIREQTDEQLKNMRHIADSATELNDTTRRLREAVQEINV